MEEGIGILFQYGAIGVFVLAMGWYIVDQNKRHGAERKEWKQTIEKQFDVMNKSGETTHSILSEIKTMLKK